MLNYPEFNPIAISVGPLNVHWYGLMYLLAFAVAWLLGQYRAKKANYQYWTSEEVSDLIFYGALGAVLGGRIGYMLFYKWSSLLAAPWTIFFVWEGGMSFHGGVLGVLVAVLCLMKKTKKSFAQIADFVVPLVPLGLGFGRLGNFINGELWGRVTEVPWGMVFPYAGMLPRHPTQLYEALGEGVLLFIVIWIYSSKPRPPLAVSALFLMGYGVIRFSIEFFREPDAHLGFVAFGWLTQGQLLSIPMVLIGVILWCWAMTHRTQKEFQ